MAGAGRVGQERQAGRSPVTVAVALLYILLWASAFIATRIGVTHAPPLIFLAIRFLVAGAIMAALARAIGQTPPRDARAWGRLALFGFFNSALYLGFSYEALARLSAGMGAILAATNPLLLALVAPWLLGERLTPVRLLGLALGFGGVVFVMGARVGVAGAADTPLGVALQVAGVICLIAATILYKRSVPREHPLVVNAVQLGSAGLVLLLPALLAEGTDGWSLSPPVVWSFVYLVFVISIGASLLWFWLLGRGEASVVSAYYFLTPLFGLALAAVILGEPFGPREVAGLIAVAAGIFLINRPHPQAGTRPAPDLTPIVEAASAGTAVAVDADAAGGER